MVLLITAIILGLAFLIWLWKVPVKKIVDAMIKSGSSTFEAYFIVMLLVGAIAVTVYMITEVI
jgi:hypothetical protein